LGRALAWPKAVLLFAAVVLASSLALVKFIPTEFVPSQDQSRLMVRVQTEGGSSIEAAQPLLAKVEERLAKHPEIEHTMVTLSAANGQYTLNLVPPNKRKLSAQELMAALRKELQGIPGVRASIQDPSQQSFGASRGSPVSFTVRGADWDQLVTA